MNSEPRRRRKDYDYDREQDRERVREPGSPRHERKERPRSSHKLRIGPSKDKDKDRERNSERRNTYHSSSSDSHTYSSPRKSSSSKSIERDRLTSSGFLERTRSSQSYPTFSKAHSKESISKSEGAGRPSNSPYTPDPTEFSRARDSSPRISRRITSAGAPPSPPLTTVEPNLRRAGSGGSLHFPRSRTFDESEDIRRSLDEPNSSRGGVRFSASRMSLRAAEEGRSSSNISPTISHLRPGSGSRTDGVRSLPRGGRSPLTGSPTRNPQLRSASRSSPDLVVQESNVDSDATPVPHATNQNGLHTQANAQHSMLSPDGYNPSPAGSGVSLPIINADGPVEIFASLGSNSEFAEPLDTFNAHNVNSNQPYPPPPPPPVLEPTEIPRIDYLLKYGGLSSVMKHSFSMAAQPVTSRSRLQNSPGASTTGMGVTTSVFTPYQTVLGNLEKVISLNGAVSVATGYNSVARQLQERLEAVFARNISREVCTCVICDLDRQRHPDLPTESVEISWGEIRELVSGRKELPQWPPFSLPTTANGLGISELDAAAPMQKLDIDVPEEFREHYLRQSKKTKHAVQGWLAKQPEDGPPSEVDDETLTFAMLTYLEPEQRRLFTALSRGLSSIPSSRAPTPAQATTKSDLLVRIGIALQRLYRLQKPPREPESCMFLLKNPSLHGVLATLASISQNEWDILISGRLDNTAGLNANGSASNTSRVTTPFSPNVVQLPGFHNASAGGFGSDHVLVDDETEIAMLAEVERDIHSGMEALEDAFERLHLQAEAVRNALMARSAGLAAGLRKGNTSGASAGAADVSARLDTPVLNGHGTSMRPELGATPSPGPQPPTPDPDWRAGGAFGYGFDDTMSLVPDDSASNIGWRERERRQRDRERSGGVNMGWRTYDAGANQRANGTGTGRVNSPGMGLAGTTKGFSKRLSRRLRPDVVREEG